MSQPRTSAAPPAPSIRAGTAPAAPTGALATAPTAAPPAPREQVLDTPRQLRRLTSLLILLGVLFGVIGALVFAGLAFALDRAESNTAQLIRVQNIQTNLLSADATATSAFLVGGLEPPAQRAAYDQAIATTTQLVAAASDAQPADARALSVLNQDVLDYAVLIEQARANNRQGFPVGAQYLRNASSSLRADALPILDNLVSANATRAADAMSLRAAYIFYVLGLLALAGLVAAMVSVARRFKRRVNVGLAVATLVVFLTWVAGSVALASTAVSVGRVQTGVFSSVNAAAAARIQANNAKSNESLTLIARGSGASFEKAWSASAQQVDDRIGGLPRDSLGTAWSRYKATHLQIRKLDDGGNWDGAVRLATGGGATSANAVFADFDQQATRYLTSVSNATSSGLGERKPLLVVLAVLTLAAGLVAALLARWGVAARLKEYRCARPAGPDRRSARSWPRCCSPPC